VKIGFRQGLIDTALVCAQGAASLKQQRHAFEGELLGSTVTLAVILSGQIDISRPDLRGSTVSRMMRTLLPGH
jgi:hypothetical protein